MDIIRKTNKKLAPLNKSKNLTGVISNPSSAIKTSKKPRRFFDSSIVTNRLKKTNIYLSKTIKRESKEAQPRGPLRLSLRNLNFQGFKFTKKRKLIFSLLLVLIIILPLSFYLWNKGAGASWWNSDWNYRKSITINSAQIPADLTNYPMLVSFTDSNLVNKTQSTGNDIIFVEDNGTRLNHEIEKFDNTTGELVAWVKIPQLDGDNDSIIYMYYGNQTVDNQQRPEDVWDDNFKTVQHLEEGGTGTRYDSTRSNTDAVTQNYDGDEGTAAKINGGDVLDGSNDYMDVSDSSSLDISTAITLSAWVKTTDTEGGVIDKQDGSTAGYRIILEYGGLAEFGIYGSAVCNYTELNSPSAVNDNTWKNIVGTWDGTSMKIYINGTMVNQIAESCMLTNDLPLAIGRQDTTFNLNGTIDEVRISNSARSANWITTEYNNQNSPSTFISLGQEEHGPSPTLYLPFDEGFGSTAHDESSNRNDGNIVGATWKDESNCKSGKCLEFDGTGDYVEINDNQSLDLSKEVTLEAWVKPTSIIPQNQTIISKIETPTDPTRIYRSVGPSATTAIAVGTSNAMNITGDRATFQTALPDNVGVGDVIQYDDDDDGDIDSSDSLAFVTGRISNTQYTISNVSGGAPNPVSSDTNWSLFRAYTSLANAEKGVENTGIDSDLRNFDNWTAGGDATTDDVGKDLVASNQQWNIACYANGTTADATEVDVNGWNTSGNNSIAIYTPVDANEAGISQRHAGKWDDNKYNLTKTNAPNMININTPSVSVVGLQIRANGFNGMYSLINFQSTTTNSLIEGNILQLVGSSSFSSLITAPYNTSSGIIIISNNILSSTGLLESAINNFRPTASTEKWLIYNNTIFGSGGITNGISVYGSGSGCPTIAKNNIIQGPTVNFNGTFVSSSTNNLTSIAPSATSAIGATYTTGTTNGTTASKLINSGETFITKGVQIGSIIKNTTDNTYTYVTALDSETQLSVANNIFVSGEGYNIYTNKYGTASFISTTSGSEDLHLSPTDTVAKNSGADLSGDNVFPFNSDIDGSLRLNLKGPQGSTLNPDDTKFDIGADEAIATQIYRSVSPNKTDALETGEENSLTIQGNTATFQRALADNVGVGDVIQYDDDNDSDIDSSDSLAFISGRVSSYEFLVTTSSGGVPTQIINDNDWSLFRAYTSLANAESGTENTGIDSDLRNFDSWTGGKDLVTSKEQWNIACYANGTTADTTAVVVDGWTTGVQNFVKIYTPVSENEVGVNQRHSGAWDDGKYFLDAPNYTNFDLSLNSQNIWIDGLQFIHDGNHNDSRGLMGANYFNDGSEIKISNNILKGGSGGTNQYGMDLNYYANSGDDGVFKVWNNIIYNFSGEGIELSNSGNGIFYIYNNTIFDSLVGINGGSASDTNLFNNIANDNVTDYSVTISSSANNISKDTSSPNVSLRNLDISFIDEVNYDLHLSKTDTSARNVGTDLSADANLPINSDIDGEERETFDIGADEAVATKIYRSVGPSNTTALATDDSHENTVSVTDGVATFEVDLPDRIGVGDAVIIDTGGTANAIDASDTLLFIQKRISSTTYQLQANNGSTPGDISVNDTYQIFRAYTSLANAESGTKNTSIPITFNGGDRNLVTNNEEWNIACYGDAVDVTRLTLDGWITGVENYLNIYTPTESSEVGVSQRHNGKWSQNAYSIHYITTGTYDTIIYEADDYVRVVGLQMFLDTINFFSSAGIAIDYLGVNNHIEIAENIIRKNNVSEDSWGISLSDNGGNPANVYISNNVLYDFRRNDGYGGGIRVGKTGTNAYILNNTIYNCGQGIAQSFGNVIAKNNITQNCVDGFVGTFAVGSDFNISDLASDATGANSKNSTTVTFRDTANKDFRLAMSDTSAKGAGLNLSNDSNLPITNDIEGEKRPSLRQGYGEAMPSLTTNYQLPTTSYSFDIGADQISSTIHNNYSLNLKTNYPQTNFSTANNDQENFSSGDINLEPNTWSHLVYKRSNDREEMYINGSKKDSNTISNFLKTNNGKLYLGSENTNSKNSFKGFLDEVRIYPYARTEDEVKKDTTQGSSGRAATRALEGVSTSIGDTANNLSDGLVGYWKMDETTWTGAANEVKDASGNNNHGIKAGNSVIGAGKFGNGGDFDGSGDYVNVGSGDKIDDMSTLTWSFWAKAEGNPGNEQGSVIDKSSGSTERKHFRFGTTIVGSDERKIGAKIATDGTNAHSVSNTLEYTLNIWEHWTMTYDDNGDRKIHIYKNGQEISYSTQTAATGNVLSDASYDMFLGGNPPTAFYAFNGKLDEIRTYNRILSKDEIKQLYNYAPGPVLHLKMDEKSGTTAFDSSGNNKNGTLSGGPIWENGKINGGMKFDGVDDYVDVGIEPSLDFGLGSFTVGHWVKISQTPTAELVTVHKLNHSYGSGWWFYVTTSGDANFWFRDGPNYTNKTTSVLNLNQWHYLSAVVNRNDNTVRLYLNGIEQGSASSISGWGDIDAEGYFFGIGMRRPDYPYFKGDIDDVKVYNYARTQEQILEDMSAQGASLSSNAGALKKPILDLNFNEGQGSTAFDASGNGNNGTLISGATGTNTTATAMWDKGGKEGGAMQFDGDGDYVYIDKNIFSGLSGFSISMWVKRDLGGVGYLIAGSSGFPYMNDFGSSGGVRFKASGSDPNYDTTSFDNNWHHVLISYDGGNATWYIDGKKNSNTSASSLGAYNTGVYIGASSILNSFWEGKIDELKIYNYALSEDEIKTLYNNSSAMAMGTDESRDNNGTEVTGANKDYCVPGDSARCDKPVLELKMDEKTGTTTYDSSGSGYNTTLNSATWANGKIGGGINFPASTGTALVQNSVDLTDTWGALTIGAWVRMDIIPETSDYVFLSKRRSGFGGWRLSKARNNSTGRLVFFFDNQASTNYLISSTNIWPTDLNWHHVSVTYDGSYLRMYGDGQQIATPLAATGTLKDLTHQICLGGEWGGSACGNADTIGGKSMDDLKIYNYARTPAQIAWDYNQGRPINQWTFDEGVGTTVHDEGMSRNDGTITGATWKNESECKSGKCLYFDGLDTTRVQANTQNAMDSFSACAWIKANAYTNADNDTSVSIFYKFWRLEILNSGLLKFEIAMQSGGYPSVITSNPISLNEWHRICGVHYAIGTGPEIFMDGIKQIPSVQSGGSGTRYDESGLDLYIGSTSNIWGGNFNGYIDDPKIYNYALTPLQVQLDYNNSSAVNFK